MSEIKRLRAEIKELRRLARVVVDALDAEKTPDYGEGHDRAFEAAIAMLGKVAPSPYEGSMVPLDEIATLALPRTDQTKEDPNG